VGLNGDPLSLHKYLYVHGDAINGFDPSGEAFVDIVAAYASGIDFAIEALHQGFNPVVAFYFGFANDLVLNAAFSLAATTVGGLFGELASGAFRLARRSAGSISKTVSRLGPIWEFVSPINRLSRLFGHNEYKVIDEVLAGKVRKGLKDFFDRNGGAGISYVDDALLEGRNGAFNTVTGEIWISRELRDRYPHLVEGTIMEELQHFHQLKTRGWFGRELTQAEHDLLEYEVVERQLRSGLAIHE
jgi:hypothetical protein